MVTRRERRRPRAAQPGLLVALTGILLAVCVVVLPPLLVPARTRPVAGIEPLEQARLEHERIALQNQARATLLQACGGRSW